MCVFAALSILRMCVRNARSVLIISEQTRAALLNSFHLIGRPRVTFHISVCVCVCVWEEREVDYFICIPFTLWLFTELKLQL